MHAPLYRTPLYLNAERVLRLCPLDVEQADAIGVIGVLLGGVPETRRFSAGVDDHDALEEASPEIKREWVEQTFQHHQPMGRLLWTRESALGTVVLYTPAYQYISALFGVNWRERKASITKPLHV